ncbi:ComEC/Rec2 family competence protein [Candidatus Uhrbacteria bacterium]|nr:ComEC/Rec2 family competence protein [Candidatus Uhrbacteria bacterium]
MRINTILTSPSKTLAVILAVFCFGVVIGPIVSVGWWEQLLFVSLVCAGIALFLPHKSVRFLFFLVSIFVFALFRFTQTSIPHHVPTVADVSSSAIRVTGVVSAEVERRIDGQRVVLDQVFYADEVREGKILAWIPLYPQVEYGNELVFNCSVQKPEAFNGFAYDRYLATKGILAVCFQPQYIDVLIQKEWSIVGGLLHVKEWATKSLQRILPEPHSSFLSGLLFGGSSALSPELKQQFVATGTSHILAASGFNVSLFSVAFLSFILSTRIGRRRGLMLTTILLIVYVLLAGASPAVVRAGIMGGLVVLEHWISRKAYMVNAFLLTGSLMLLVNPLLLQDVGFQLSFVATIAVITFTKPISERLTFIPEVIGLRESFAGSLAAIGLTLPIVLWHFGSVSLVAPFVNLLVLPLVPYAMVATMIAIMAGGLGATVGAYLSLPAWGLSYLMLRLISVFGTIPFALSQPEQSHLLALLVFGLMGAVWMYYRYAPSKR